ncbi:hypothetical protein [Streptomyces indicus]|uniref:Uncharacterized protein n=1 Tax=Streptomyces indicus TaxID=417292 RepID=A0A1G9ASU3_9ACTN|nr:hypothetical protein [Streptomyces indicus]SDK29700.1 hypothetical protein SAMN05421806_106104 [Streptomyces indicus]
MRGLKHAFDRSPAAQIALSLVLVAGIFRLAHPGEPPSLTLLRAVLLTALAAVVFLARRHAYLKALKVDAEELRVAEGQFRRGEVPASLREREVLRRLVAKRRAELAQPGALFYLFLVLAAVGPIGLMALGAWVPALTLLAVYAALTGWMVWMRRRTRDRVARMEEALGRSPDARASSHT